MKMILAAVGLMLIASTIPLAYHTTCRERTVDTLTGWLRPDYGSYDEKPVSNETQRLTGFITSEIFVLRVSLVLLPFIGVLLIVLPFRKKKSSVG